MELIVAEIAAIETRLAESSATRLDVIDRSLSARVKALTEEASQRVRDDVSASLAKWQTAAREDVNAGTRTAMVDMLEEAVARASDEFAKKNATAVDLALLAAQDEAARDVKRRAAGLEKRLRGEMEVRLAGIEKAVAEAASRRTERMSAELKEAIESDVASVRADVGLLVASAVAKARDQVAKKSAKRVSKQTKKAVRVLRKENEEIRMASTEAARTDLEAHAKNLAAEAAAAAKTEQGRLREHVDVELRGGLAALERQASQDREEIRQTLNADLEAAGQRISAEVRADLAESLANVERRIEDRLSVGLADSSSKLIEQGAANLAVLSARAAELAAESRAAAEDAATRVADKESRRLYAQAEGRLQGRIDDVARATLDEAIERVRTDGAAVLEAERQSFFAGAEAAHKRLGDLMADLESRERRRDLRLAKRESTRRVKSALSKLEAEGRRVETRNEELLAEARFDLERMVSAAATRIHAAEGEAGERLGDTLRQVEETVTSIEDSNGRIAELERRAAAAERDAARSAEMARNALELEPRMREALRIEAAAAEQIAIAERRLIDFVVHR